MAIALPIVFASCSGGAEGDVLMTSAQRFEPSTITVSVGQRVTFANDSSEAHTVTAFQNEIPDGAEYFASGGFDSEEDARDNVSDGFIGGGETFSVRFDTPGTYEYVCIPHEPTGMTGTVVVEE
jgi:plastocyanin